MSNALEVDVQEMDCRFALVDKSIEQTPSNRRATD